VGVVRVTWAVFVSSRNAPERRPCSFFWSPEHRAGPFRHIAAKFNKPIMNNIQQNKGVRMTANFRCFQRAFIRFHLNENDKFALFGSKRPSASGGHCLRLNLQLHIIDLVRTCRISSFCTVAWQLARFQLTWRIARSLGDSWASCYDKEKLIFSFFFNF